MRVAFYLDGDAIKDYSGRLGARRFFTHSVGRRGNCPCAHVFVRAREIARSLPPDAISTRTGALDSAVDEAIATWGRLSRHLSALTMAQFLWLCPDTYGEEVRVIRMDRVHADVLLEGSWLEAIQREVKFRFDGSVLEDQPVEAFKEALAKSIGNERRLPDGPIPVMVVGRHEHERFECVTLAC